MTGFGNAWAGVEPEPTKGDTPQQLTAKIARFPLKNR